MDLSKTPSQRAVTEGKLWQPLGGLTYQVPYKIDFADVLHLVELVLVLPISAVQCECAVSAQNLIKSSTRATLNVSVLEDLVRLSSEGPLTWTFRETTGLEKRRSYILLSLKWVVTLLPLLLPVPSSTSNLSRRPSVVRFTTVTISTLRLPPPPLRLPLPQALDSMRPVKSTP